MSSLAHLRRCVIAAEAYATSVEEADPETRRQAEAIVRARRRELADLESWELRQWRAPEPSRGVEIVDVKAPPPPPGPPKLEVLS